MANKEGLLILFSGPSGVGKDTVLDVVLNKNKKLQKSISLTTRNIRENETDGKDYYFISVDDFKKMIADGEVLEYAQYGSNLYGTPKGPVDKWLGEGKNVILKIEVQGAENIPEEGPVIIAANHYFFMDPIFIAIYTKRFITFMAKSELFKNKLLKAVAYCHLPCVNGNLHICFLLI